MATRLDEYLHSTGRFESRSGAKAAVMAGLVSVDGSFSVKPGMRVRGSEDIQILPPSRKYVSRGGEKLEGALEDLGVGVAGMTVLDVGASTGGFTDCLLQRGVQRVVAVDVGRGQLDWKLRRDDRVEVFEGVNARYLNADDLPGPRPGLATIDVSFISLLKVIGPVMDALEEGGWVLALVKPQFEAGPSVAKGGVVRDPAMHLEVLERIQEGFGTLGLRMSGIAPSHLKGPKGNVEFFCLVERGKDGIGARELEDAIARAHRSGEAT
jgi:23S rRNA (cytidine1920-2'-O)/16S rRNA (cytidine1409-2'-O)-methyltransferase